MSIKNANTQEFIKVAIKALEDKKAEDIKVLDIHEVSIMADYFIIATANNINQVKAIADEVEQKLYEIGCKLVQSEGYQTARWILLDFGDLIIHIFQKEDRQFYQLERVWADAKEIKV